MNLKFKIISGFLILSLMLLVAGIISIREFLNIGQSVQEMLDENYRSINACERMTEALEREDSGILLLLLGHKDAGKKTILAADSLFNNSFRIVSNNVSIDEEDAYVQKVEEKYLLFSEKWQQLIYDPDAAHSLNWYYDHVHGGFLGLKQAVSELMVLNQDVLYHTASELKSQAHRSVIPGIVAIVASFVFAILFYFFIHLYVIRPVIKITEGIESFNKDDEPYQVQLETRDELGSLNNSIHKLINKMKA